MSKDVLITLIGVGAGALVSLFALFVHEFYERYRRVIDRIRTAYDSSLAFMNVAEGLLARDLTRDTCRDKDAVKIAFLARRDALPDNAHAVFGELIWAAEDGFWEILNLREDLGVNREMYNNKKKERFSAFRVGLEAEYKRIMRGTSIWKSRY